MTTRRRQIDVGGIAVEIVRKDIKHLHVGVYPPSGRVRVAAPMRVDEPAVRLAVASRLGWIRRQQKEFATQRRESVREFITGESHFVAGRRCLLDVVEADGAPSIRLSRNRTIVLTVRPGADRDVRETVMQRWYRQRLHDQLAPLVAKWAPVIGVSVKEVRIRRMKTRWGSCNADARRIWLNLELAKKPPKALEFILVHEMVHLLERHHTERFRERIDALLPNWRRYRQELNQAPLVHDEWQY